MTSTLQICFLCLCIGIDNSVDPSDGDGFQYSSSPASNDDFDDEKLCVLL